MTAQDTALHGSVAESAERATMSKIIWRTLPLLILCYFIGYIDRTNVSFAALGMNKDLGFSAAIYGTGAGIFFIGYFFLEIPSNIVLDRVGARTWIARIMVTWGIIATAMTFISGTKTFYLGRFLLGAAEAGFFPGVILFMTYWFPSRYRAWIVGLFMAANPVSTLIGAPLSGWILGLNGAFGLEGWRWLFIIEGLPAIVVGVIVFFVLPSRPAEATWLTPAEKTWLERQLAAEQQTAGAIPQQSLWKTLAHPYVLALALVYFGLAASNYGMSLWLPQIIKGFGASNLQTGFIAAVPYLFGTVALIYWGRHSDKTGERVWHVISALIVAGAGLIVAGLIHSPVWMMVSLCVGALGIFGGLSPFWALPTALLRGTGMAGGLALINSIGNLSGFFGPKLIGYIKTTTGSFSIGLYTLAALPLIAAVIVFAIRKQPAFHKAERRV